MSFAGVLVQSAAISGAGNTATIAGISEIKGALWIVNTTAISQGATLQITLQVLDTASGLYVDFGTFGAVAATGVTKAIAYPNASGAIAQALPAGYRLKWTLTGGETPSATFSIGVNYLS